MDTGHHPRKRGQRTWTDAQRAQQAANLHARQIWLTSTGPRTAEGKAISRCNALKHGATSRPAKNFMRQFRTYREFLRLCWQKRAEIIEKQKNELINRNSKKHVSNAAQSHILKAETPPNLNLPPVAWIFEPLPPLNCEKDDQTRI